MGGGATIAREKKARESGELAGSLYPCHERYGRAERKRGGKMLFFLPVVAPVLNEFHHCNW